MHEDRVPLRVWADVPRAKASELPESLHGKVDKTAPDPLLWWLKDTTGLATVRAFVAWRREFCHTIPIGTSDDVTVVAAWLARSGHDYRLTGPDSYDTASFTTLWWTAHNELPDHPGLRKVVAQLGAASALARALNAPVRLRQGAHSWPGESTRATFNTNAAS